MEITIKNTDGNIIFKYDCEDNTIKKTIKEAVKQNVYLSGANLSGANLKGVCLKDMNLNGVNLSKACLIGANFKNADLENANLEYIYAFITLQIIYIKVQRKFLKYFYLFSQEK